MVARDRYRFPHTTQICDRLHPAVIDHDPERGERRPGDIIAAESRQTHGSTR
jgi:hypothetical protein